jgi:hypothetical protein
MPRDKVGKGRLGLRRTMNPSNETSRESVKRSSGKRKRRVVKRTTSEHEFGKRRMSLPVLMYTIILPALLALGVVGGLVVMYRQGFFQKAPEEVGPNLPRLVVTEEKDARAEDWKGALPMDAVNGFVKATSHEERLKWVRQPEKVDEVMREFFEKGPGAKEEVESINALALEDEFSTFFTEKEARLGRYAVVFGRGGKRLLTVTQTDQGARVDFPSYARLCSEPWDDVLTGKVLGATVRVFAGDGNYYNGLYQNEAEWRGIDTLSPDVEPMMRYYAARGNEELMKQLDELFSAGPSRRVIFEIRGTPEGVKNRQWEIVRLVMNDWVE